MMQTMNEGFRKVILEELQEENENIPEVTEEELREMVNALGDDEVITVVFGEESE